MTLLTETIDAIQRINKRTDDVSWVGNRDGTYAITWNEFTDIADVEYDYNNYTPWVASDLVIVGKSGWFMERDHDYDRGREFWSIHTFPRLEPHAKRIIHRVVRTEHESRSYLDDLNSEAGMRSLKHSQLIESKLSLGRAIAELRKTERVLGNDTPEEITNALRDLEDKRRYVEEELEDYE